MPSGYYRNKEFHPTVMHLKGPSDYGVLCNQKFGFKTQKQVTENTKQVTCQKCLKLIDLIK